MCERANEIGGRWDGYLRKVLGWIGRRDPVEEGLAAPDDVGPDSLAAFKAWLRERDHMRDEKAGRPWCEECKAPREENEGILHRRLCSTCDLRLMEDRYIWPLVMRLGRKGARRALASLVRGEIGPQPQPQSK